MAWNEPGGGNQDPWGNRKDDQGPPDLDEVVRALQDRFGGLFGNGGGGGHDPHGSSGGSLSRRGLTLAALLLILIWAATGFYVVEPAERGVVLRFGAYVGEMTLPGLHWHIPWPVERVEKVNVDEIVSFSHKASILTQDENIVDIELTVQSRIRDADHYLFKDQMPDKTLRDATETVLRKIIGSSRLDFVLTEGRGAISLMVQEHVQSLMDYYQTGLLVTSVNMQPAKPPEQVKSAFDDAIKAREDKERQENQAEAYANDILPRARGEAARMIADAKAYRDQVVAEASGDAARFTSVLTEYLKAPEVTRERLYIQSIEEVLMGSNKVFVDVPSGNSLMYLPLDQMMRQPTSATTPATGTLPRGGDLSGSVSSRPMELPTSRMRDVSRERRPR